MTASQRKFRRRSIAADEAHAWARSLKLNNPAGNSVLRGLSIYANSEGVCFVGIDQLAEDTNLSADTVRRRLVWLEQIGAIVRISMWIDANGRRNGEGRGKRTSDDIRLLLDGDMDEIEAAARGESHAETEDPADSEREISPSTVRGLISEAKTVSPALALGQPSQSCEGLISEPEPEDSPQPPSGGAAWNDIEEFRKAWDEPIGRHSLVEPLWVALTPDERKLVCRAATGFRAWQKLERQQKRKPPNYSAQVFLRERKAWNDYAGFAADSSDTRTVHPVDSLEARAIAGLHAVAGRSEAFRMVICGRDGMVRWRHPVTPQLLRFADLPKLDAWVALDRNGGGAWEAFLGKYFEDALRRTHLREGARAPWPWPPGADGKLYPAPGPPAAELNDRDAADFK